jgi:hypothetical protein
VLAGLADDDVKVQCSQMLTAAHEVAQPALANELVL